MRNTTARRLVLLTGALTLGLGTAGAATAAGGATTVPDRARPETATAQPVRTTTEAAPTVEHQSGIVLECAGSAGDVSAVATVYENQMYGSSLQVVLGDPEEDRIGSVEQTEPFVVDGAMDASVEIQGETATVAGTVAPTGRPEKLTEPIQDAGEQIISQGTHTRLATDLALTVGQTTVPLECAPAFAYDLEVRKVALYGN